MKRFTATLIVIILLGGVLMLPVGDGEGGATIIVQRGDTLGKLAKTHGITVQDLRALNGLNGDLIQVGQELKLDSGGPPQRVWQRGLAMVTSNRDLDLEDDTSVTVGPVPTKRTVRPGVRKRAAPAGNSDLYQDDQGRWIDAQGRFTNAAGQPIDADGNVLEDTTRSWPSLSRPAPKPCLDADTGIEEGGDTSFGRSKGLSGSQVSAAVRSFQEQTLRCAEGKSDVSGEIGLELVVGCDGRVRSVTVTDDRVMAGDFATCVADVMRYAPFPPHARDEVTVQIPLRYD